jgi:hypothetical protein
MRSKKTNYSVLTTIELNCLVEFIVVRDYWECSQGNVMNTPKILLTRHHMISHVAGLRRETRCTFASSVQYTP